MTWLLEDANNKDFLLSFKATEVRMGLEPMAAAVRAKEQQIKTE